MSVSVRGIQRGDAARLKDVRLRALRDAPSAFGSTYEREAAYTEADWDERAHLGAEALIRTTFFAFDAQDAIVGLVGAYRDHADSRDVHLVSMWTDPAARRHGIGRALVAAVLDWARGVDADAVHLWVTRGNAPAESLYEAMDFVVTGEHQPLPSDPCKDEVRMVHRLR